MQKEIKEMMRFILVISAGFGVGGLITGLDIILTYVFYNLNIRLTDFIVHIILFLIWGVMGGLAIGIALKKDKKLCYRADINTG